MMKAFVRLVASLVVCLFLAPPFAGASSGTRHHAASQLVTFRLQVSGSPTPGATFWVAYGPLADRFGLVQLHPAGHGTYVARQDLPAEGRTVFAFLAGNGVIRTRFGPAPGDPVTTIQRFGPVSVWHLALPTVHWEAPVG